MSFVTLFSDKHGFLACDQRVFSAAEMQGVQEAHSLCEQLSVRLDEQLSNEELMRTNAEQRGYQDGMEAARQESNRLLAEELAKLNSQYEIDLERLRESRASAAVDIVRRIAGQIKSDEWLLNQAREAAGTLLDIPAATLKVHTSRYEEVKAGFDRSKDSHTSAIRQVVADDSINNDACILETAHGCIEVDLETQLGRILDLFSRTEPVRHSSD